ncbi:MAG: rRNA pseudouridine synthase [Peptococcaceae bacterium]|nr:rRNA pseudouridine synthase [Peptococcaceae bacterium]
MERLQKYLARCGVASRRQAEQMITAGRVAVNGVTVLRAGVSVEPGKDRVSADGRPVVAKAENTYIMLNKPAGVLCTCRDPHGRKTALELLPDQAARLFPVGRLDWETEGLLLLTDDGELANRLTHPRYMMPKTYLVETPDWLTDEKAQALREGVRLADGLTRPARVVINYRERRRGSRFSLTITEGRNRQVRRMCEALALVVRYLCRVQLGSLTLGDLQPGDWRPLTAPEAAKLKSLQYARENSKMYP